MARGFENGPGALYVDGREVCQVEVAASLRTRRRGLLGRRGIEGAMFLTPAASVHTVGMQFAIDVAYVDRNLTILSVVSMVPGRIGWPRLRARHVIETELGRCSLLGIRTGSRVQIRPA
jgi:uncharacterized membrane protein (UPF0127 family)